MAMNEYPIGALVICRFCFPNRALTPVELATFASAGTLPGGVGVDPTVVLFDYQAPGVPTVTYTGVGANIIKDAAGAYHVTLNITSAGVWQYRGYGTGAYQAATPDAAFNVRRDFT